MLYKPGDLVIYGYHGVCTVKEPKKIQMDGKFCLYLVLEPTNVTGSTFMIPVEQSREMEKISPILSREEIDKLLISQAVRCGKWEIQENLRRKIHAERMADPDREKLIRELYTVYRQRDLMSAQGRRLHRSDEDFLRDAERKIAGEIGAAMGLSLENSITYLREKLK